MDVKVGSRFGKTIMELIEKGSPDINATKNRQLSCKPEHSTIRYHKPGIKHIANVLLMLMCEAMKSPLYGTVRHFSGLILPPKLMRTK